MSDASSKPDKSGLPLLILVVVVVAYLFSSAAGALLTSLVYLLVKGTASGADSWLTSSVTAQFIYGVITYGVFLAIVIIAGNGLKISWSDIRLGKPSWKDPLLALLALPVYYALYLAAITVVTRLVPGFNSNQEQQIGFSGASGPSLVLVFLSLVVIPPIVEEIITRGYVLTGLKKALPLWLAAIGTSLLFAVGHLEFGTGGPLVWVAALFTFVLSLVLIYLRQKTGRLWAGIFLHALVNGVSFVALFIAK